MSDAIVFENYSLTFDFSHLLQDVSFRLRRGDSLAVVGAAGSGKSLLLNVLSQLIWETAFVPERLEQTGHCSILDCEVAPKRPGRAKLVDLQRRIVHISARSAWLPLPIAENFRILQEFSGAREVLPYHEIIATLPLGPRTRSLLDSVAEQLPDDIEPPLLQHLAIARAWLRKPDMLLLDDPFPHMDPVLLRQTEKLIAAVGETSTIVWATNDLFQASRMTDWILLLRAGRMVELTETAQFFTHPRTRLAEDFVAGREDGA